MSRSGAGSTQRADAALVAAVQYNCDVADARHARDGALCTYLLGMRELFRWSSGTAPGAPVDRAAVGAFISAREAFWDALSESAAAFQTLPVGVGVSAFDEASTDTALRARRLVYGGGIGRFGAPVFFLAERMREAVFDGVPVVYAGKEFARGIVAPPAVSRGGRIVVRTDAMRRWLWTRAEAGPQRGRAPELAALFAAYGGSVAEAIERIVADQADTLALHEVGELRVGAVLGADWERLLDGLDDRRVESVVRAVRDLFADCLVTVPALIAQGSTLALRFWFANLEGLRSTLSPRLAALAASGTPDAHLIRDVCAAEGAWFRASALELLSSWRAGGTTALRRAVDALLEARQVS